MNTTKNYYEELPLYMSMAGSGNPWGALTTLRKQLMRALFDKIPISELGDIFNLTINEIKSELTPLVEAHLVKEFDGQYHPAFFIANGEETQLTIEHASHIGQSFASHLLNRWNDLDDHYNHLAVSKSYSFQTLAFLLVGGRLLDIGLLEALAKDRTLLLPAPSRPSSDRPDARYYFFMIEGDLSSLGKYGQEDISLPWSNWYFLSFGRNFINGKFNNARQDIEEKFRNLIDKKVVENPQALSKKLNIPLIDQKDAEYWLKVVRLYVNDLVRIYNDAKTELEEIYTSFEVSKRSSDYFGEFICWHVHFTYASAIDNLVSKGVISLPSQYFTAMLWYREHKNEGLLKYF